MFNSIMGLQETTDTDLNAYLDLMMDDEIKCEASHSRKRDLPCSGEVTHEIMSSCNPGTAVKVCDNCIKASEYYVAHGCKCIECERYASECWTWRPI
jgi:hypothetical protein